MPYVRRRRPYRRRRPIGRRRLGRPRYGYRRKRYARIPRRVGTGSLRTKCTVQTELTIPAFAPGDGVPFAMQWALSDLTQATTYTALFRMYRLRGVKLTFFPTTNMSNTINASWRMLYNFNPVAAIQPNSLQQQEDKQNNRCKWMCTNGNAQMMKKVFYKPRTLTQVYESAIQTGYTPGRKLQWISTRDPQVPYFGMEGFMDTSGLPSGGLAVPVVVSVRTTYYLEFRGVV